MAEETIKSLKAELAAAKENLAIAEALLAAAKAEQESLQAINTELVAQIEGLETQQATPALAEPSFTLNGVQYGFQYPSVQHKNIVITPNDVIADEDLQAELVAMQSGFIYPIF